MGFLIVKKEEETQSSKLTSVGFCNELLKNSVAGIDESFKKILVSLDGAGDSVFELLRPLITVKLTQVDNSDSETESDSEAYSLRNQYKRNTSSSGRDLNNRSADFLSTVTSEANLLLENTVDGDKVIMDTEEGQESEAPTDITVSEPAPEPDSDVQEEGDFADAQQEEPPAPSPAEEVAPPAEEEAPPAEEAAPEGATPPEEVAPSPEEEPPEGEEALPPTEGVTSEEEPSEMPPSQKEADRTSTISNIPVTDSAVRAELKEADEKAVNTARLIEAMRRSIAMYNEKEELSEEDARDLEIKQQELMEKLAEFEKITKRVQMLVGLADLSSMSLQSVPTGTKEKETVVKPTQLGIVTETVGTESPGREYEDLTEFISPEDKLPKVVVCGMQDSVPRIIVCDGLKKKSKGERKNLCKKDCPNLLTSLTGRLTESYNMQEKLACDNVNLEGARYNLEEALLCKDNAVDCLQKKVGCLQTEMKIILKENTVLSEKLCQLSGKQPFSSCPGVPCGRPQMSQSNYVCGSQTMSQGMGPMQQYSANACQLECQLNQIESEVKHMQCELGQLQRERQQLEQQRKMIKSPLALNTCSSPGANTPRGEPNCNAQLRELREQYNRLQDDFKNKLTEVASLRNENISLRQVAEFAKEAQEAAEETARNLEEKYKHNEVNSRMLMGSKEQLIEQEQQLNLAKQRYREAQDELDEVRALVQDQSSQLEDYKNKYLQAQEQVEEQRRKIELLEMDNSRISEQVNLEFQRIKNQFQEKLQELSPLPDILTATQMKLKEANQMKLLAEHNLEEVARELAESKEQLSALTREMHDSRTSMQLGTDERAAMKTAIENWERRYNELKDENTNMKASLARMEEAANQNQIRLQEKLHEIAQLTAQLETVREESARQVSRTKDRSETVRRSLQSQIYELEKQLAQSRAAARSAQSDKDEIRQRMQSQINNLTENFDQAQVRIQSLQSHVNFLKTSYADVYGPDKNTLMIENAGYGTDTCDCKF